MASEWVQLDQLGAHGMQPDLIPEHRVPGTLDYLMNCRAVGQNIANAGGFSLISAAPLNPTTHFWAQSFGTRFLVVCTDTSLHRYMKGEWVDITGPSFPERYSPGQVGDRWTGGFLDGTLVLGSENAVRYYQADMTPNESIPLIFDKATSTATWEDLGGGAHVFRPFHNHMFAAHTYDITNNIERPTRVMWSDTVDPGEPPEDWVPTAENRAGDVNLADTPGVVVDMVHLRDKLIIYKQDAIYTCEWTGGNFVFRFRKVATNQGIFARDSVVEYQGVHWGQGMEDLFVFDGNTVKSIAWGKVKESWLNDRDADRAANNFTFVDHRHEEVVFAYVSSKAPSNQAYPDKAIAYCAATDSWSYRDYGEELSFARTTPYIGLDLNADFQIIGLDHAFSRLIDLENAPDRLGYAVPAQILRTALFADKGHDFVQVDQVRLGMRGSNHSETNVRLGGQIAPDASISWRPSKQVSGNTDYKTDIRHNDQEIAYQIDIETMHSWQIACVDLKVQRSGSRG